MIVTKFRSSIYGEPWTRIVINHVQCHTKVLLRAPCGLQNAIEGQRKDLGTRDAARGLVYLSASRSTLALAH